MSEEKDGESTPAERVAKIGAIKVFSLSVSLSLSPSQSIYLSIHLSISISLPHLSAVQGWVRKQYQLSVCEWVGERVGVGVGVGAFAN